MTFVHATIGVPGSGKSTFILSKFPFLPVISPDDIRKELTEDASDQSQNDDVWKLAYDRLEDHLFKGQHVIFDATQANPEQRRNFLNFVKERGGYPIGWHIKTSLEETKRRNIGRNRVVPGHVVERMYNLLEENPPTLEEGFHRLYTVENS